MKLVSVETPEKSVCKMTFSATAEEPVSYTHLDVYKRQGKGILNRANPQSIYDIINKFVFRGRLKASQTVLNST